MATLINWLIIKLLIVESSLLNSPSLQQLWLTEEPRRDVQNRVNNAVRPAWSSFKKMCSIKMFEMLKVQLYINSSIN